MESLRSGVTSIRVPEVAADFLRPALGAPQEAPHVPYQLLFVTGAFPSHGVGLDHTNHPNGPSFCVVGVRSP